MCKRTVGRVEKIWKGNYMTFEDEKVITSC